MNYYNHLICIASWFIISADPTGKDGPEKTIAQQTHIHLYLKWHVMSLARAIVLCIIAVADWSGEDWHG